MSKRNKSIRISERDRQVLAMAAHGMVTPYFVQEGILGGGSLDAARSLIRRLVGDRPNFRYLRPEPLDNDRVCYLLTDQGRRLVSAPKAATYSMKKQKRINSYAIAWFIFVESPGRRRIISLREYPELFDVYARRLPRHPFYMTQAEGEQTLGVILIDYDATPRRMLYKTEKVLRKILNEGWLDDFLRSRRFVVTTLTFNSGRKRLYETHLPPEIIRRLQHPLSRLLPLPLAADSIRFEFHVVPGLESVIFGSPMLFDSIPD